MNLLPIATPTDAANGAAADNPGTIGRGDFTALLAMLVEAASTTLPIRRPPAEVGCAAPESGAAAKMPVGAIPGPDLVGPPAAEIAVSEGNRKPISEIAVPQSIREPISATAGQRQKPAAEALEGPGSELPAPPTATIRRTPHASLASEDTVPTTAAPEVSIEMGLEAEVAPCVLPSPVEPSTGRGPDGLATEGLAPPSDDSTVTEAVAPTRADVPRRAEPNCAIPRPAHPQPQTPADQPVGRPDISIPEKAEGRPAPKISATFSSSVGSPNPMVPLVAVNRSEALSPVDVPPATPVAPPDVSEQIVSAVVPLHGRGDGRHEVTLELRPDHLGTIRVEVSVEHQTVHLTLHATEPATSRLLSAALPELRTALADAGLTAGHLGVGPDDGSGAGQWRKPPGTGETHGAGASAGHRGATTLDDPDPVRPARPAAAGRLDLFL